MHHTCNIITDMTLKNNNTDRRTGVQSAPSVKKALMRWWPSTLTATAVLWLTLTSDPVPDVRLPSWLGQYGDKVVHAIMFGGLTGAIIFDYKRRQPGAPHAAGTTFLILLGIAMTLFGIADEWLQDAMGLGRTADIYDIAADIVGIVIGLMLAPAVCNRLIRQWRVVVRGGKP